MRIYFVVASMVFCHFYSTSQEWVRLTDIDKRFSILFPFDPNYKVQDFKNEKGNVTNESYYLGSIKDHPNEAYVLGLLSYDYNLVDLEDLDGVDQLLQNTAIDLIATNKMKLSYKKVGYHQNTGTPFIDLRAVTKDEQKVMRARVWLGVKKLIILQVYTTSMNSLNEYIDLFINSYEDPSIAAKN
jgi:hypothetical protein